MLWSKKKKCVNPSKCVDLIIFARDQYCCLEFWVFLPLDGCLAKVKENSLTYYLPIAGGRRNGFGYFTRALVRDKRLYRDWNSITNAIS